MHLHQSSCHVARLFALATVLAAPAAVADMVQGVVSPADARVVILDASNTARAELPAGPFQVWLETGDYVAECKAPRAGKRIAFRSLSQPTDVNIDCR